MERKILKDKIWNVRNAEPKTKTKPCKHRDAEPNSPEIERLAALLPPEPTGLGKAGVPSRTIFENITAGTYLWKKVGWKGVIIFLLCLVLMVLLIFMVAGIIF